MLYDFAFDRETHLLTVRWYRYFTPADVLAYGRDYMRGFVASHFRSGYRLLLDMSLCEAQPRDTLEPFMTHMKLIPKASRIAVVATAPMMRNQVDRLMTQPYRKLFGTLHEAQRWVLS